MLRCFLTVAERGNLADAAEALGRTPSAVSMMLRQFEDHIGAPLFEAGRKSRLTRPASSSASRRAASWPISTAQSPPSRGCPAPRPAMSASRSRPRWRRC
ncbi:LysR family transcriptional regulator [Roseovarius sp. THAF8]|uniref:helix-turn-helix domain-containing protein n=1 Tax=Roseovarius sp. THAF8 TaxID=2587846 RepID=UPI0020C76382|nr:LysR family transcriptional regulator [Roseovarius sp. THAF8]